MNIENFLYFLFKTTPKISGIIFADDLNNGKKLLNNLANKFDGSDELYSINVRDNFCQLAFKNNSSLDILCYDECLLCGKRADFIINYDKNLNVQKDIAYLLVGIPSKFNFIYDGINDKFLSLNYSSELDILKYREALIELSNQRRK